MSDTSFWIQFLHDSNLSIDNNTLLQYGAILADRFSTIEELLTADENELINLGITNQLDRVCLIKQARLFNEKKNSVFIREFNVSNHVLGNCHDNNQSTLIHRKSKCNLPSTLLSRISFHNHYSYNELTNDDEKCHVEHIIEIPERIIINDNNEKIQILIESHQKKILSSHGMRPIKSLSSTISLKKKITIGTDRLKRLTLSRSLFKRQSDLITKKISNITNKILNPLTKIKNKNDSILKQMQEIEEQELNEHEKTQVLSLNNEIEQSTDLIPHEDVHESKHNIQLVQTLVNKRFKLGTTTTFLTRSLANYNYMK
ncbi:unnamed protein product [Rotaria sordida]|uniref:SAM domain-containing protein n=1 Tax=Rotaria sordida TaxID=392033 RepID=A0A814C7P8_9BILA|nr:unnamed protein product [Rotaria sordida]CAF0940457.1 unnamed protein product [Rotaria sordida]CAF3621289.1 unnamed protein product [Rotaria sordida]